jgi:dolichyl-diphosphooligosaccharide---protein glycosyltransferase
LSWAVAVCTHCVCLLPTRAGKPPGYDRVRNCEIGNKEFELQYLDEAFTSEHWIVRVYKVRKEDNRA